jgi:hypothetical protein
LPDGTCIKKRTIAWPICAIKELTGMGFTGQHTVTVFASMADLDHNPAMPSTS